MTIKISLLLLVILSSSGFILNEAYAFLDFGGWEKKYNLLFAEFEKLTKQNEDLIKENQKLKNDKLYWEDQTYEYYDKLTEYYDKLTDVGNELYDTKLENSNLKNDKLYWEDQTYEYYDKLTDVGNELYDTKLENSNLKNDKLYWKDQTYEYYDKLTDVGNELYDTTRNYNSLLDDYDAVYDEAYKPRVEIEKTKLRWTFHDTKGNDYGIVWDIEAYEKLKVHSDHKSKNLDTVSLRTDEGRSFTSVNLDGFVNDNFVSCCIDELYKNSKSNSDFIYEVWWIVSQMTIYDLDVSIESEGRYALETIHRGGGDCEDLVILIASMLKSSSYTKDWDMQYVYMDSDNPTNPKGVNHVILYVDDGEYNYYIEATGKPKWDYYSDGVTGWRFDV